MSRLTTPPAPTILPLPTAIWNSSRFRPLFRVAEFENRFADLCEVGLCRFNLGLSSNQVDWWRDGMRCGGGGTRDFAGLPNS